jgi:antitoxin (DNA-binding transcriptional repressor) of toxin-antitoxin stability system
MCYAFSMTRMTVRDVRLHWPLAEKALAQGEEIIITRDSRPVARLLPLVPGTRQMRRRFDPVAHARQIEQFWSRQPAQPPTDQMLRRDRED